MKQGRPSQAKIALGTMIVEVATPNMVLILQSLGFDFFVVDCEHGSFSDQSIAGLLTAARCAGLPGLVRVPEIRKEPILKSLEAGAAGLLVPHVATADEVEAVMQYAKYAPRGMRGVSLTRPHTGYRPVDKQDYMREANEQTKIWIQIERHEAVDNLPQILSVPGVDAILVGPNDLAQSLSTLDGKAASLDGAIDRIVQTATAHGVPVGIHVSSEEALADYITQRGMTFGMWSSEINMILSEGRRGLSQLREAVENK